VPAPAGHIGARVKCGDDPRLLTGRGRYVDDLTLPRMAHVAFVRSTHAHARVTRVGLDAARRAPGVVGVLTGAAAARLCKPYRGVLLHYKGMKTGAMLPLAVERVRYVGEPIVVIAAESRAPPTTPPRSSRCSTSLCPRCSRPARRSPVARP